MGNPYVNCFCDYDSSHDRVRESVQSILGAFGVDPDAEGTANTPERVTRFYLEFLNPDPPKMTTFEGDGYDEMVVVRGIRFYSLCEHHMLPIFGTADVAYIPSNGRILGLSKIPRLVEWFARRLQTQERLTEQVASQMNRVLAPEGVGVTLRARHMCMEMRGVRNPAYTVTSSLSGAFKDNPETRHEFLSFRANHEGT